MSGILTIAGRELRALFYSPAAWVTLAVVQAILAYLFLTQLEFYEANRAQLMRMPDAPGVTELIGASLIGSAGVVLLLIVPLLTMRLISEERRNQTLSLLLTAPVSATQIVLGKYLATLVFLGVVVLLALLMPLSLLLGGTLDFGLLASAALGLLLLVASFAAVGLFISCLTATPMAAGAATFGILLLLWVLDWTGSGGSEGIGTALHYLSLLTHYEALLRGVFNTADVGYFLVLIVGSLLLGIRRLDAERLGH